ncbi:retrotransposon gag domain-containing protein, partial [Staphylococcus aureus]|nr:retrotransposon gag domain-containing protein [Staphylococcus aureus]
EEISEKLKPLALQYDGTLDPQAHLTAFADKMHFQSASDSALCKTFPLTLKGIARTWFSKLLRNSVFSFEDLSQKFLKYFSVSKKTSRTSESLFNIVQRLTESLRKYYKRFNKATLEVENLSTEVASEAFR